MLAPNETFATGLVAVGATQATALPLNAKTNVIASGAASTGVSLPSGAACGDTVFVSHAGANALAVYPATAAGTINGGSAGAASTIAVTTYKTKNAMFLCTGSDNWISFLGA